MINPKRIFLIDALGALLTTFLLFGVLAQFELYFGMPKHVLYLLASIAFCLFIFSLGSYKLIKVNWKPFLRILITFNSAYLMLSIGLIIKYSIVLTELGWIYFILEFIVIGILIYVEYMILSKNIS